MLAFCNALHSEKAKDPMYVTEFGMSTCSSELQDRKAEWPMVASALGIQNTCFSELQEKNAEERIEATELGMYTSLSKLQE